LDLSHPDDLIEIIKAVSEKIEEVKDYALVKRNKNTLGYAKFGTYLMG
jgi:hypothetical protein